MDLWEAVRDDDVSKVRSLLKQGANPNHQLYWSEDWCHSKSSIQERLPPVHEACEKGYLEITRALVSGGADNEKGDRRLDRTAFHRACWGGQKEIVVYLSQDVKCRTGKCVQSCSMSPTGMFCCSCIATFFHTSHNYDLPRRF